MKNSNKGITLIALIITIIVLLILAGVSIATLTGENGILTQAKNARNDMTKAEVKERIQLEILGSYGTDGEIDIAILKANIAKNIQEAVIGEGTELPLTVTVGDYTFTVKANGVVEEGTPTVGGNEAVVGEIVTGENKPYTKNGKAMIPVGFAIVPGLDDVSEGLVISDDPDDTEEDSSNIVANGNQFVWVPVSKENFATEFVRHDFGNQGIADENFVEGELVSNKYTELAGDGINVNVTESGSASVKSQQEAQEMYKSVKENGGFYIGRYEAGKDGSYNVLCKKGVDVYNYIQWGNSMTDETGKAVEKARGFAEANNYEAVESTLVYGVQWDSVMRWISKDNNLKGYLKDSSTVGNYTINSMIKTGTVKEYQLKNIYDMAGNAWEWTMEALGTNKRIVRGGYMYESGASYPVSWRKDLEPDGGGGDYGFRVALYLSI